MYSKVVGSSAVPMLFVPSDMNNVPGRISKASVREPSRVLLTVSRDSVTKPKKCRNFGCQFL